MLACEGSGIRLRGPFVVLRVSCFGLSWLCTGVRGLSLGLGGPSVDLIESCVDPEMTFCRPVGLSALCRPKEAYVDFGEEFTTFVMVKVVKSYWCIVHTTL